MGASEATLLLVFSLTVSAKDQLLANASNWEVSGELPCVESILEDNLVKEVVGILMV